MRMYVKVMAAVIACMLLGGEAHSAFATTPRYRKSELVLKEKEETRRKRGEE